MTTGLVNRAGSVGDLVLGHPLEGAQSVSTVAAICITLARDEHLRRDVDIGPGSLPRDLDSVGQDRGRRVRPARATVLGDVLVVHVSQVVGVVYVVPDPLLRDGLDVDERSVHLLFGHDCRSDVTEVLWVDVPRSLGRSNTDDGDS